MSTNEESILTTVKAALGLASDYDAFDSEVTMHINSVFGTLHQLGIGPALGFEIEDSEAIWKDFTEDLRLSPIKSYIFARVKMLFDPPTQGFVVTAMKQQIEEFEWRLNIVREDQLITELGDGDVILDAGP